MLYAAPERWLEPSLYQNRAGWTKSNLKYKGIEDWCLAGVHFGHPQVLWVSTDPVDVRKDCQQGTMPQTICSLNMYLTTQPNFYKLGLRWLYNGNDDFCPRIYNLFGVEKTKRSEKSNSSWLIFKLLITILPILTCFHKFLINFELLHICSENGQKIRNCSEALATEWVHFIHPCLVM